MTDAPREITVEEIDEFEHWVCQIYAKSKRAKAICALARRALSQESGLTADEMMGVGKYDPEPYPPSVSVERERETQRLDICASCGQPFRSCKCFNAPDTPQSVPTCTCSKHPLWDGYDGDCPIHGWFEPVAPDTPQSVPAAGDDELAVRAERDKLREACDGYLAHAANLRGENAKLEERASVLEGALESIALRDSLVGELQEPQAARIARAALRTSEDAK
jgi:hypothetical protein